MDLIELLKHFGIPALIGAAAWKYLHAALKEIVQDVRAIKAGTQATLRAQMIESYNKWSERGYAPIYARENFENCWKQYHTLGDNGVMDNIHDKFLALPTEPPEYENG